MSWKRINFQLDAREFYREENYLSSIEDVRHDERDLSEH